MESDVVPEGPASEDCLLRHEAMTALRVQLCALVDGAFRSLPSLVVVVRDAPPRATEEGQKRKLERLENNAKPKLFR